MSTDQNDDFNAKADFYHRQWGINIIPAPTIDKGKDSKDRQSYWIASWLDFQTGPMSDGKLVEDAARQLVVAQRENQGQSINDQNVKNRTQEVLNSMYNSNNNNTINFSKVDSLVVELGECIQNLPDVNDLKQRVHAAAFARNLLFIIYNLVHGLDIVEFCGDNDDDKPTRVTEEQQQGGVCY